MFSKQLITVILWVLPALAALSPPVLVRRNQNPVPGRYIVTLKDDVDDVVGASSFANKISRRSTITHEWDIINGFAGNFTDADLEFLRTHPNVASIEEDGYFRAQSTQITIQYDAPWGLGRISSKTKLVNQDSGALFRYDYVATGGAGSDVYIIDTGILTTHLDFGGRAFWGATFGGYQNADGHGHGTHGAGIAVSGTYGVAKSARVFAVKVLDDTTARGSFADIISGVNWVAEYAKTTGRPSVVSLAVSGDSSTSTLAVANLVSSGVTVVLPAGNDNVAAEHTFLSYLPSVLTVGASTIADTKADYSNWGAILDIWAPGSDVISTWNDGGTKRRTGTSGAASYVTGFVAYLLSIDPSLTPVDVDSTIKSQSLKDVLTGIPDGTINALLYNGLDIRSQ